MTPFETTVSPLSPHSSEADIPVRSLGAKYPLASLIAMIFFSTFATIMGTTILPAFYLKLGLTPHQIGSIEGFAWLTAFLSKFLAGLLSDRLRQRKALILWGTRFSVLSKACFAFATGGLSLGITQIADRFAKGLRSSPADALIADLTLPQKTGFGFGLKYAVSLLASVLGGSFVYALLKFIGNQYRIIFGLAVVPAFLACWIATRGLKDAPIPELSAQTKRKFRTFLPLACYGFLFVLFFLMFGRFSLSFFGLKALHLGLPTTDLPRFTILYDCCAAAASFLSGILLCRFSRPENFFKAALLIHSAAHLLFFWAQTRAMIACGVVLAGVHLGLAQSTTLSLITRFAPCEKRATALSLYYLTAGIGVFLSNKWAGFLNEFFASPSTAFLSGACFCLLAWSLFTILISQQKNVTQL